jgi:hypothetical protein
VNLASPSRFVRVFEPQDQLVCIITGSCLLLLLIVRQPLAETLCVAVTGMVISLSLMTKLVWIIIGPYLKLLRT